MSMRIHELHPSLAHYPLALFPAAVIADLVGWLTRSRPLMRTGASLMPIATASAVVTGAAGLIAQESVVAEGEARDLLVTHRNLNLGLVGIATAMTVMRARSEEPGPAYLVMGLAGIAGMVYTAYLGGKMVYDHGVGVLAADGVREEEAPEILPGTLAEAARKSAHHAVAGVKQAAYEAREGKIAPQLAKASRSEG